MRNLDQKRAQRALDDINEVTSNQEEYGSLARGLPMMLQTNGLGQTMAFLKSKGVNSQAHRKMYGHLSRWLNVVVRNEEGGDFLDWVVKENSTCYRRAANEAIEFGIWLRRFAEAQGWTN